jgi:hypothetical protein
MVKIPPGPNTLEIMSKIPKLVTRLSNAHGKVIAVKTVINAHAKVPQKSLKGSHRIKYLPCSISLENGIGMACTISEIIKKIMTFI